MNKKDLYKDQQELLKSIHSELESGLKLIERYPKTVTFFGSARTKVDSKYYKMAEDLASQITRELGPAGYVIVSGGGSGTMEAASKGSREVGGRPIGISINLPTEQKTNSYVSEELKCNHFATRKIILSFATEAYIFMPGGFGTMDELFGILTLIQTKKTPKTPIILFGTEFWNEWLGLIKKVMQEKYDYIDKKDLELFTITDDIEKVLTIIMDAPVQEWWEDFEMNKNNI